MVTPFRHHSQTSVLITNMHINIPIFFARGFSSRRPEGNQPLRGGLHSRGAQATRGRPPTGFGSRSFRDAGARFRTRRSLDVSAHRLWDAGAPRDFLGKSAAPQLFE